jgi:hypothetical protein
MEEDVDEVVDDLLQQLKGVKQVQKNELNLDREHLEEFLLKYSGKLVKGSVDYVDEVKQFITSAPDSRDLEAFSKIVGASAAAIESLNKILINNEKNKTVKEVELLKIEAKKQLTDVNAEKKVLTMNREELLNKLIDDATVVEEIND